MRRCLLVLLSVLPLLVTGCKKGESNLTQSSPSPTPVAQATTTPSDTNRTAKFIVLLYHRFEDRPAELVTTPNDFRAQMKALKDNGISVISMQDLLAWRKGEKAIPSKSAVITIDDEWNSQFVPRPVSGMVEEKAAIEFETQLQAVLQKHGIES